MKPVLADEGDPRPSSAIDVAQEEWHARSHAEQRIVPAWMRRLIGIIHNRVFENLAIQI